MFMVQVSLSVGSSSNISECDFESHMCLSKEGIYIENDISPDLKYVMVTTVEPPYSNAQRWPRFPQRTSIYELEDAKIKGSLVHVEEVAYLPLADNIPIAHNACRTGRRAIYWREDAGSNLMVIEALDGGNPETEVPHRDSLFTLKSSEGFKKEHLLTKTVFRFAGMNFFESGSQLLVMENWWRTRRTITTLLTQDDNTETYTSSVLFTVVTKIATTIPALSLKGAQILGLTVIAPSSTTCRRWVVDASS